MRKAVQLGGNCLNIGIVLSLLLLLYWSSANTVTYECFYNFAQVSFKDCTIENKIFILFTVHTKITCAYELECFTGLAPFNEGSSLQFLRTIRVRINVFHIISILRYIIRIFLGEYGHKANTASSAVVLRPLNGSSHLFYHQALPPGFQDRMCNVPQ